MNAIKGKKISKTTPNPKFAPLSIQLYPQDQFFQALDKLLLEVPPIKQSMRYGNKAFRDWLDKIDPVVDEYLAKQLPYQGAGMELRAYLLDSFGNK